MIPNMVWRSWEIDENGRGIRVIEHIPGCSPDTDFGAMALYLNRIYQVTREDCPEIPPELPSHLVNLDPRFESAPYQIFCGNPSDARVDDLLRALEGRRKGAFGKDRR